MRSQTVSTGCDDPEGKGRPRAPRRQDAIGARAGYGGIRRRARRCAVHGRSAGHACQGDGGRAVRGACAHVGLPSPAACCLGVGGGRVRVLVCKMFREEAGQATVEAAFALPIALALVILLVQPGILLYDRIVMQQAAAETCRLLATTPEGDPSGVCRAFALRRLGAVPEQDCFHVHQGGCTWEVELEGGESLVENAGAGAIAAAAYRGGRPPFRGSQRWRGLRGFRRGLGACAAGMGCRGRGG